MVPEFVSKREQRRNQPPRAQSITKALSFSVFFVCLCALSVHPFLFRKLTNYPASLSIDNDRNRRNAQRLLSIAYYGFAPLRDTEFKGQEPRNVQISKAGITRLSASPAHVNAE